MMNFPGRKAWTRKFFPFLIIAAGAALVLMPMIFTGIPDGPDMRQHMQFADEYHRSLAEGNLLPDWSRNENIGMGSPGIRIYPPLSYYPLAAARLITGDWAAAVEIAWFLILGAGAWGVYLFTKYLLSGEADAGDRQQHQGISQPAPFFLSAESAAVAAALLYLIMPYQLGKIYQTWFYAELAASAVLPFCFLYLARLIDNLQKSDAEVGAAAARFFSPRSLFDCCALGLAGALLILTHIPMTVMGTMALLVYALLLSKPRNYPKILIRLAAAGAAALSASSFFWIKVMTEKQWSKATDEVNSTGVFDYRINLFPLYWNNSSEYYAERLLLYFDILIGLTALFILLPSILVTVLALRRYRQRRRLDDGKLVTAGIIPSYLPPLYLTTLFCLFMMTTPSDFIWQILPPLQKTQFPWRWLTVIASLSSICFVTGLRSAALSPVLCKPGMLKAVKYAAGALIFLLALFDITQNILSSSGYPSAAAYREKIEETHRASGCLCWVPVWGRQILDVQGGAGESSISSGARVLAVEESGIDKIIHISRDSSAVSPGDSPVVLSVPVYYYPYWTVSVNGNRLPVSADKNGLIRIALPPEADASAAGAEEAVHIRFENPPLLRFTRWWSLAAWIILGGGIFILSWRGARAIKR